MAQPAAATVTIYNGGQAVINNNGSLIIGAQLPTPPAPSVSTPYVGFDTRTLSTLLDSSSVPVQTDLSTVSKWKANVTTTESGEVILGSVVQGGEYRSSTPIGPGLYIPMAFSEPGGGYGVGTPTKLRMINNAVFVVISSWTAPTSSQKMSTVLWKPSTQNPGNKNNAAGTYITYDESFYGVTGPRPASGASVLQITDDSENSAKSEITNASPAIIGWQYISTGTQVAFKYIATSTNGVLQSTTPVDYPWDATVDTLNNPVSVGGQVSFGSDGTVATATDVVRRLQGVFHEMRFYDTTLSDADMLTVYQQLKSSWNIQ